MQLSLDLCVDNLPGFVIVQRGCQEGVTEDSASTVVGNDGCLETTVNLGGTNVVAQLCYCYTDFCNGEIASSFGFSLRAGVVVAFLPIMIMASNL